MNEAILKGKWQQLEGEVRQTWGKLTDDDMKRAQGSAEKLAGVLRERYGWRQEEATKSIADFLEKMEEKLEKPTATTPH